MFTIEKVYRELNEWDARTLSTIRRVTLMKVVLLAIPYYFMSFALIPISICNEIGKIARAFIWGSSSDGRKSAQELE